MVRLYFVCFFSCFFCFARSANYYVNDATSAGDAWCTAAGNDANNGTSTSSPKATIADVLNDYVVGAGDIIYVDKGTYTETGINIGVNDDGSASGYVTIQGAGNSVTIFNTAGTQSTFYFNTSGVQYVKIMDLQIIKNTVSYNTIQFSQSNISYIRVENCVLSQAGNNEVVYGDNTSASSNSNITFSNSTLTNSNTSGDADGIELTGNFDNLIVSNCTFNVASYTKAMYITTSNSSYLSDQIQINNNTFNMTYVGSSDAYGVYVQGYGTSDRMTNVSVYDNILIFSDMDDGVGIYINDTGTSGNGLNVYRNKVRNGQYGIQLYADITDGVIHNNYVSNSLEGMYVNSGTSVTNMKLYFNSFYTKVRGVYISDFTSTSDIQNNIFYTTSSSSSDAAMDIGSNSTLASILNYNLYYAPNGADIAEFGSSSYATMAAWKAVDKVSGGTLGEENGQNGDPKFVNPAGNDLDITNTTSAAINKAVHIGGVYTSDIYSVTRSTSTPWIGAYENQAILPVELLAFFASCAEERVFISWLTASEHNSSHFRVDKSRDGDVWNAIGVLDAAGNSSSAVEYSLVDVYPINDVVYYRLAQYDLDGLYDIYGPVSVDCINEKNQLSIYPNPVNDNLYVTVSGSLNSPLLIEVKDVQGKKCYSSAFYASTTELVHVIDCSNLEAGIYMLHVTYDSNKEETRKFIVR